MAPYAIVNRGWRHPSFWMLPGLSLFCLIWGFFFAFTAPYLIVVSVAPLAVLFLLAIWALPDARTAPIQLIAPLIFIFEFGLVIWPNYIGMQFPGTPWITLVRMIELPLVFVGLVSFSTLPSFRAEIFETLRGAPVLWKLVIAFCAMQFITLPMAGGSMPSSIQEIIVDQIGWTFMFFAGCWIFRKPGRVQRFAVIYWIAAILISMMGILEYHQKRVLWDGHIPDFLKIDAAAQYLLAYERMATDLYRTKTTFTTPLGEAEFLALSTPMILQFVRGRYPLWVKGAAAASIPVVLLAIYYTDSRLGLVGSLAAALLFTVVWTFQHWRLDRQSLMSPLIVAGYPFAAAFAIAMTFVSTHLRERFWGGTEESSSNQSRIIEWTMGIPKIMHNPFGHGPGRSAQVLGYQSAWGNLTIDSYYLSLLLDVGVIGLILFLSAFVSGIYHALRVSWRAPQLALEDPDQGFLAPFAVVFATFLVIKIVYAEVYLHPLLFLMLGAVVALNWRAFKPEEAKAAAAMAVRAR